MMNITAGTLIEKQSPSTSRPLTATDACQDPVLLNDWHAIGFDRDFVSKVLYPVRLLGRDLVVWRSDAGDLHVWEDLCVHRGARLSKGSICDNQVVCPYHGWQYNESGACTLIPSAPDEKPMSKARAFPHQVAVRYGFVWTCLGDPANDIPRFDEWHDDAFVTVLAGPYEFKANGFRSLENFLDIAHFPFVHGDMNAVAAKPDKLNHYQVRQTDRGLQTSEITVRQAGGDARGVMIVSNYTYNAYRPLVGHFVKRIQDIDSEGNAIEGQDTHYATYCTIQAIDEVNCIVRVCGAMDAKPMPPEKAVVDRYNIIFRQDRDIVETQRPERIPADLRYELHHRTDLLGQRYRSWLRSMGITYGTI